MTSKHTCQHSRSWQVISDIPIWNHNQHKIYSLMYIWTQCGLCHKCNCLNNWHYMYSDNRSQKNPVCNFMSTFWLCMLHRHPFIFLLNYSESEVLTKHLQRLGASASPISAKRDKVWQVTNRNKHLMILQHQCSKSFNTMFFGNHWYAYLIDMLTMCLW